MRGEHVLPDDVLVSPVVDEIPEYMITREQDCDDRTRPLLATR